jgi:hypothetical protein
MLTVDGEEEEEVDEDEDEVMEDWMAIADDNEDWEVEVEAVRFAVGNEDNEDRVVDETADVC